MSKFTVVPSALAFAKTIVRGAASGLNAAAVTKSCTVTNLSGATIHISGVGFTDGLANDTVTQPSGLGKNSDFTVVPNGTIFPVSLTNGSSQQFDVTFAPLRSSAGFDVRSTIVSLVNDGGLSILIPVGGPVIETGYDNPTVSPIFANAGKPTDGTRPVRGLKAIFNIADIDSFAHGSPMLFFAAPVTGNQSETTPIAPAVATYTTASASVPYALRSPAINGSPRGGRGYQLLIFWTDDTVTMDITVKAISTGGHITVATFTGVTYSSASSLFLGHSTGLDLEGLSLTVTTTNVVGSSAYNIGAVVTG